MCGIVFVLGYSANSWVQGPGAVHQASTNCHLRSRHPRCPVSRWANTFETQLIRGYLLKDSRFWSTGRNVRPLQARFRYSNTRVERIPPTDLTPRRLACTPRGTFDKTHSRLSGLAPPKKNFARCCSLEIQTSHAYAITEPTPQLQCLSSIDPSPFLCAIFPRSTTT
jgi:hypothetical protein